MAKHYSLAHGFRRRVSVVGDGNNGLLVVLDSDILDLVGAKEGDEFIASIAPDGTIALRKV